MAKSKANKHPALQANSPAAPAIPPGSGPPAVPAQPSTIDAAVIEKLLVRYQVNIHRRLPVLLLSLTSMVLLTLCFEPFNWWWLPWFALVPWLVAIATSDRWGWMLFCSWLAGFLFIGANSYWLLVCGYPGPAKDVLLMVLAQVAVSAYLGCYFLLFAYVVGGLVRRWPPRGSSELGVRNSKSRTKDRPASKSPMPASPMPSGLLMTYLVPIGWVGTEILRGYVLSGFPWFFLGHGVYQRLTLIQIADLGGAYAVSFLLAAANGLLADGLLQPLFLSSRHGPRPNYRVSAAALVVLGLILATVVYGRFRIGQIDLTANPGPQVTVIQCNYPIHLQADPSDAPEKRPAELFALSSRAVAAAPRADLVAWPETMLDASLNGDFLRLKLGRLPDPEQAQKYEHLTAEVGKLLARYRDTDRELREASSRQGVAMLVGAHATVPAPAQIAREPMNVLQFCKLYFTDPVGQPSLDNPQFLRFNSACLYQPLAPGEYTGGPPGPATAAEGLAKQRYDKHHLVPFGEYLPFRTSWPAAFSLLRNLTPMSQLSPGENLEPLKLTASPGRQYALAAPICYEDVVPQAVLDLVYDQHGKKQVDFLVNISNDGWFAGTTELWQHRAAAAFRCVENRVPLARSVNCGCSGFFDSLGRPMGVIPPGKVGFLTARLPLDNRTTVYGRIGDWPGFACAALLFAGLGLVFIRRRRAKRGGKTSSV